MAERSLIAIVTPAFGSPESIEELKREAEASANGADSVQVRMVAPAIEINPFHHTLGDIDEPREEAKKRLDEAVAKAREAGLDVCFEVGDPDPVQAAQDALLARPAEEVVIFSHADDAKDWYEGELWKHAEDSLEPPLKLIVMDGGPDGNEHVVKTEVSSRGYSNNDAPQEVENLYVPGLSRGDLAGIVLGIVGTIIVIILAAAATAGSKPIGWSAVAIGIAIATALANMSNVVGQILMESVRYRGGFAKMFRDIAVIGTPIALLINLAILIFA